MSGLFYKLSYATVSCYEKGVRTDNCNFVSVMYPYYLFLVWSRIETLCKSNRMSQCKLASVNIVSATWCISDFLFYIFSGPIAANWLLTEGDIYATNFMKSINAISNCPSFVERGMESLIN